MAQVGGAQGHRRAGQGGSLPRSGDTSVGAFDEPTSGLASVSNRVSGGRLPGVSLQSNLAGVQTNLMNVGTT